MMDDRQLLRRYTDENSEAAFGELVARHVNLVYSAALRRTGGDTHLAQDVAQLVFTDLARKARSLPPGVVLAGWLHRASRFAAAQLIRTERRRQLREQEAFRMNPLEPTPDWEQIRPLLDAAMDKLTAADRDALVLRFMEQRSLAEVGAALGANEDAARKRVQRALEKMRVRLVRQGVSATAASLSAAIAVNAVQSAPAGLAVTLASASLATAASGTAGVLTWLKYMIMTKLKFAIISAVIVAGITLPLVIQHQARTRLRERAEAMRQQNERLARLTAENEQLEQAVARARSQLLSSLPAPPSSAAVAPIAPPDDSQITNLLQRLIKGEAPKLTREQIDAYLKANHRNAASLLAMSRETGDPALLREALEKYPDDPRVNYAAVFDKSATPAELRQRLDAFEKVAPDNALPNYLSALDYFKSGQTSQAVQELNAANGKTSFQDYSWDFEQNAEEAWRSAGYPEAETSMVATWQLMLPQLAELKNLNEQMVGLANSYQQSGDAASALTTLQMDVTLGQQLDSTPTDPLITQLVGLLIQRNALQAMDPNSPYGTGGQTVQDELDQLTHQKATIKDLVTQTEALQPTMSPQDWITHDARTKTFGEVNAMQWLLAKYAPK